MTRLPRGAVFCSSFRLIQERACSASSYVFMACCVAASSPFPGENDAFEMITAIVCLRSSPGAPTWGLEDLCSAERAGLAEARDHWASPLGRRHQESVRQPPFRAARGHQFQRGALDAERSHQDPFCRLRPRQPGRKCPERKYRTSCLLYAPLRIWGKQNKMEGRGGWGPVCEVNPKFWAHRQKVKSSPSKAPGKASQVVENRWQGGGRGGGRSDEAGWAEAVAFRYFWRNHFAEVLQAKLRGIVR